MRIFLLITCLILLLSAMPETPSAVRAQDSTAACDTLIDEALEKIANTCLNLGRNEICYGNPTISTTLNDDTLIFEAPGDIIPVTALNTIITRPANPDTDEWGVALMDIQADLPDSVDESVRLVLLGGVDLVPVQNEVLEDMPTCTFTANRNADLYAGSGFEYNVVDIVDRDDTLEIYGQNDEWLRSARGWIPPNTGSLDCEPNTLRTIESVADAYTAPMQAFTVQVTEQAQCESAPSGLVIQAPTGETANLLVNNVEMRIGSTAYIGLDGSEMTIATFGGSVSVLSDGRSATMRPGEQVIIALPDPLDQESGAGEMPRVGAAPDAPGTSDDAIAIDLTLPVTEFSERVRTFDPQIVNTLTRAPIDPLLFTRLPDPPTLCSTDVGSRPATVTFINQHNAPVSLYWVDVNCQEIFIHSIAPNQEVEIATNTGSVYTVRDADGNRLLQHVVIRTVTVPIP